MKLKRFAALILMAWAPWSGLAAQGVPIPDTPAGRIAAQYIKSFNSGSDQVMARFFIDTIGQEALLRRSVDERLRYYRQMWSRMGALTVFSVADSTETAVSVLASAGKGGWFTFSFLLTPKPPYKIDQIRIEQSEPPSSAPETALSSSIGDDELRQKLAEFMTRLEAFGFSGGVLIARKGTILLEKGCGLADRSNSTPCGAETAFDIGSNTKDFTKTAVLQLAEQGRLRLDDPIATYFDGVPPDKAGITIGQLLEHTAGLKLYSGPDEEAVSRDEFLKRMFESQLVAKPGTEMKYSNPGYSLLAAVIEKISGQSYEAFVNEHIFKPAGMSQTGYVLPKWKPGQIAHSYSGGQDRGSTFDYPHAPDGPYWNLRGNGGTLSTLGDMYRFYLALEGDALLSQESKARLFPQDKPLTLVGGDGIHYFVYYREPALGLAVFIASTDAGMRAMDLERTIVPIVKGRDVPPPPRVVKLAPGVSAKYAGGYRLTSGARLIVTVDGDGLALVSEGQEAISLLMGDGPDATARLQELNARSMAIVDAAAKGDYGPLSKALGPQLPLPLEEIQKREDTVRKQRTEAFGALQGTHVLGTVLQAASRGPRTTMSPVDATTIIRYDFERGSAYTLFMWGGGSLVGIRPQPAPPAIAFLPQSQTTFASYDLSTGRTSEIGFSLDPAGRVTGLKVLSSPNPVEAKRAGEPR